MSARTTSSRRRGPCDSCHRNLSAAGIRHLAVAGSRRPVPDATGVTAAWRVGREVAESGARLRSRPRCWLVSETRPGPTRAVKEDVSRRAALSSGFGFEFCPRQRRAAYLTVPAHVAKYACDPAHRGVTSPGRRACADSGHRSPTLSCPVAGVSALPVAVCVAPTDRPPSDCLKLAVCNGHDSFPISTETTGLLLPTSSLTNLLRTDKVRRMTIDAAIPIRTSSSQRLLG